MELTSDQLTEVKDYITQKKTVMDWMTDNGLSRDDVRPVAIVKKLKEMYGDDEIATLLRSMRDARFGIQVTRIVSRMMSRQAVNVAMCDSLIAKLQDCLVTVQAKKSELE